MGVPEMRDLWARLEEGARSGTLDREERELAKKFAKAVKHLTVNPFHPGLQSHEIDDLTKRYKQKTFESYLENNTPAAGRLFWVYGPEQRQITVIGLEPHPEDAKNGAYGRVKLSALPKTAAEQAADDAAKDAAAKRDAPRARPVSDERRGGRRRGK
jgi:hypothetical protein